MATEPKDEKDAPKTYSMHVSAKYLELTKKKLELTRLPRELELPEPKKWEQGTPKSVLEPLLDFWLDGYDWRAAEARFNLDLPQYRTTITTTSATNPRTSQSLRIHFVHKHSKHKDAVPLLFCHSWPSSFIEVQRVLDALTDPHSLPGFGDGAQLAFHVVVPSIPGFGFSEASESEQFGLNGTAEVFDKLMQQLGYDQYVTHGAGWGFHICRALALGYPEHCLAVHTVNPNFEEPTYKRGRLAFMKYWIAKLTQAKVPCLSFGYLPPELQAAQKSQTVEDCDDLLDPSRPFGPTLHRLYSHRPQTLAFSLCDSPVGLLAGILDVIHARVPSLSPVTSRSRSPFLSPVELEMQKANTELQEEEDRTQQPPISPRQSENDARNYTWSPTEILNFTMLQWLPGPEAALRWLRRAHLDTSDTQWHKYCLVPLGVSSFLGRNKSRATPLIWGAASWDLTWIKRHQRPCVLPAWEQPDLLVLDLRECFGTFLHTGKLSKLSSKKDAGGTQEGS